MLQCFHFVMSTLPIEPGTRLLHYAFFDDMNVQEEISVAEWRHRSCQLEVVGEVA